jgi:hypothetical protein
MATLAERIATLEEAIATGARRVVTRTAGATQETEFHSLKDMEATLARLKAELAVSTGGKPRFSVLDY